LNCSDLLLFIPVASLILHSGFESCHLLV
jgi:hypothetical protein